MLGLGAAWWAVSAVPKALQQRRVDAAEQQRLALLEERRQRAQLPRRKAGRGGIIETFSGGNSGRYRCMSLYLLVMVMFKFMSLIPRLQFVDIVKKSCCTSAVLNSYSIEMNSWLHFWGATVVMVMFTFTGLLP